MCNTKVRQIEKERREELVSKMKTCNRLKCVSEGCFSASVSVHVEIRLAFFLVFRGQQSKTGVGRERGGGGGGVEEAFRSWCCMLNTKVADYAGCAHSSFN